MRAANGSVAADFMTRRRRGGPMTGRCCSDLAGEWLPAPFRRSLCLLWKQAKSSQSTAWPSPCYCSRAPLRKLNFPLTDYTTGPGAVNLEEVDAQLVAGEEEGGEEERAASPALARAAAPPIGHAARSPARSIPAARGQGPRSPAAVSKRLPATPHVAEPAAKRQQHPKQQQHQQQQHPMQQQPPPPPPQQQQQQEEAPGYAEVPGAMERDGIQATEVAEDAEEDDAAGEVAGPAGAGPVHLAEPPAVDAAAAAAAAAAVVVEEGEEEQIPPPAARPAVVHEGLTPAAAAQLAQDLASAVEGRDSYAVCDVLMDLEVHYLREPGQDPAALGPLQVRAACMDRPCCFPCWPYSPFGPLA